MNHLKGPKNGNWKGGKYITSHGYVAIRTSNRWGALAYEYEHRLVAERKLGRKLKKGEIIHHIDGNKTNNDPDNIMITGSIAEHFFNHRKNSNLRKPDEANPIIYCRCGCGKEFSKFDTSGRPRIYVSGHNMKVGGRYVKNSLV